MALLVPDPSHAPGARSSGRIVAPLGILCAVVAILAGAVWAPAMVMIAQARRPPQLNSVPHYYPGDVRPFQHNAQVEMWIIVVASIVAILAFAIAAMLLGRRALRQATPQRLRSITRWAYTALLTGLLICIFELLANARISFPFWLTQALLMIAAAAVMASFILSGIAARRTRRLPPQAGGQSRARGFGARTCLVLSSLSILFGFALVAFLAQFIVSFYLHFVF